MSKKYLATVVVREAQTIEQEVINEAKQLEAFFSGSLPDEDASTYYHYSKEDTKRRTYEVARSSIKSEITLLGKASTLSNLVSSTPEFNSEFINNKQEHYHTFRIPKAKGGYRTITAPNEWLKELQTTIAKVLGSVYIDHEAVHAYTPGRSNVTNAQAHKQSNHFVMMDFADFFPSINKDMIKRGLTKSLYLAGVFEDNKILLDMICEIALLDGGLPQGSPLSPLLSNIVMLDFDHQITERLKDFQQYIIYTRYADDITFSSKQPLKMDEINTLVNEVLDSTEMCNLKLAPHKTKYLTNSKRVYLTGVKLNEKNKTTFGHEKKTKLKRDVMSLIIAKREGTLDKSEAQGVLGMFSYASSIEPGYFKYLRKRFENKYTKGVNLYKYLLT